MFLIYLPITVKIGDTADGAPGATDTENDLSIRTFLSADMTMDSDQ